MPVAESLTHWVQTISACSRFLSEDVARHPDWLHSVCDLGSSRSKEHFQKLLQESNLPPALFRRRELVRIVLRDRLELAPLSEITEEISNLADAILESALSPVPDVSFCVLALGKLGGRELNYSSDVDLMFLYTGDGEAAKKLAGRYVGLLSAYTAFGPCYRVDLRLRPEGNLGEVAISLAAAKEYYARRARAWELQMLIKARVCAGDPSLGRHLLQFVEPLIYATTDDFSTIEGMSAARERIGERLARRRRKQHQTDVKLARGGIRDVEFLVQCLQRLHGAREVRVRHGSTLLALTRLHDGDLLSSTEYWRLTEAYGYLRQLEHLLQLEDDRQTHSLPASAAGLERIARLMTRGQGDATQLLHDLNQHMENVQTIYERIVYAQRPLHYMDAPRQSLLERSQPLDIRPSDRPLTEFLASLESHPAQLQLLQENPAVKDWMLQVFELSPHLAGQLMLYPDLLDEIRRAADHPTRHWAFEGLAAPLNDTGALRRFFRREMFRIQAASVCLPAAIFATLDNTSALAEFVIARAYRIALERTLANAQPADKPQNEMIVVALGRLGMREFDLASDADLVFVLPDTESKNHQFWTRVAESLIEILTSYTSDGTILSLDTRLRPNGREGLLVQTESAYVDYFSTSAEAWEGIAYMKARAVAGDTERATGFLNELQQVDWRRYGQSGRSKNDLHRMRLRLQREQGEVTPLKAASGGYYDADFILMFLRLRGAGMFFKSLNTPERIDVLEKMGHLDRADAAFLLTATTYFRALDHAIRLVTGRSQGKIPAAGSHRRMVAELLRRWTRQNAESEGLETHLAELQKQMRRLFESVFG